MESANSSKLSDTDIDMLEGKISLVLDKHHSEQVFLNTNFTQLHSIPNHAVTFTLDGPTQLPGAIVMQNNNQKYVTNRSELVGQSNLSTGMDGSLPQSMNSNQSNRFSELLIKKQGDIEYIVHNQILEHFGEECLPKIAQNQTIIYKDKEALPKELNTEQDILELLKKSKNFNYLESISKLAEGGEAIIFTINYLGCDEVVIKVPKLKFQTSAGFEDIIFESQLIKSIYHEDYIVEIKEEIIELDKQTNEVTRYCVVVERAKFSLYDLYSIKSDPQKQLEKSGLWFNKEFQSNHLEQFSVEKFLYQFFHSLKGLNHIHKMGVIYQDLKPQNLLIMRNQKVKYGDFGISIPLKKDVEQYNLRGISPDWSMPSIKAIYEETKGKGIWTQKFSTYTLQQNDIYGLVLTFSTDLIKHFTNMEKLSQNQMKYFNYFALLMNKMANQWSINLDKAEELIGNYLMSNLDFVSEYLTQLVNEKKFQGAYYVGQFLQIQATNIKEVKEEDKLLYYMKIYQMMSEFKFNEGDYTEAKINISKAEYFLNTLQQNKKQKFAQDLINHQFEIPFMIANINLNIGQLEDAQKYYQMCEQIYQNNKTQFESKTLGILLLSGEIAFFQNNIQLAMMSFQKYFQEVDHQKQTKGSINIFQYINALKNNARVQQILKNFDQSLDYYERASKLIIDEYGSNNPQIIDCLKNIGSIYIFQKKYELADEKITSALKICRNIFGEKNSFTAETYRQMGDIQSQFNSEEALISYKKALMIYDSLFGPDNQNNVVVLNNMAHLYLNQSDFNKAEQLCLQCLEICQKNGQSQSKQTSNIYENLCKVYLNKKELNEALDIIVKAYNIKKTIIGAYNIETLQCLLIYIQILAQLNRAQEANQLCEEAYPKILQIYGEKHEIVMKFAMILSKLRLFFGKVEQSKALLQQQLKNSQYQPGEVQDKIQFDILLKLAQNHEKQGKIEAINYYKQALEHCPSAPFEFEIHRSIAFFYVRNQKIEEGMEYLNKSEEILMINKDKHPIFKQFETQYLKPIQELRGKCQKILNFKKHNSHSLIV
ncbi:protein kinase domain containing protein [Stylonychia lemnae]|uniref:Protein kinase domain containing protein n=1 Tax=Stylonychia lemnae TaxID=5949 RepID=A0A078B699_STYLE|nr:protein kinase domain containing protein [Stylonychia lemnae]|eukprot:CDW89751.1 protein kinase domain containing protein [Stylonychia lemnae]